MPQLVAAGPRVIALDPRGSDNSDRSTTGYDMGTIATKMHGFANALSLLNDGPYDVAGHDIGTWIGYAYLADWPRDVRRLAVFDIPLPALRRRLGVCYRQRSISERGVSPLTGWMIYPRFSLLGRERAFRTWYSEKAMRPWSIGLDEYARQLASPGSIREAGSYY